MKKITYISLLTIALTWSACSDNEMLDSSPLPEGNLTVQATIDNGQPAARTHIYNTSNNLFWTPGDEIGVYGTTGNNIKFFSVETNNQKTARFSGSFPNSDTPVYAYYPYSATEGDGLSGEGNKTWNVTLPENIEFARLEDASPVGADRMGTNAPMIATSYDSEGKAFAFKHVCGLMRITIASIPADAASLVITSADQNISGKCTIADITASSPQLTPPTGGNKTVTITLPQTETYGEKTFYIPLPVATYSKLTMELKKADDSIILQKSISNLPVACGQLVDMNKLIGLELKPSEVKSTLATALANGGTVDVLIKDVTAADATIEFPTFAQGGSRTVNLLFADIPTTKLTIKKAEGEGPSIGTLNVKLPGSETSNSDAWTETPAWTDVENAPDFDISLPGAKITLDSDNEDKVAQYGTVSLAGGYSSNIGSTLGNITINSLTIAAGTNIDVTAVIGKISIPTDNSNTSQVSLKKGGYCYNFENLSGRAITYKNLLAWDGTLKCKPLTDASGQYLIRSAAELAYFQRTKESALKGDVTPTMNANASLCCDINLNNKPWMGIVLAAEKTFNGGSHTISNLKVEEYSLEEQSKATPRACAGLFSTTLQNSTVTNVILNKANIAVEAKWCGALIGHSYSGTVSQCTVKNVTVGKATDTQTPTHYSYRMGGLIGYVDCTSNVAITDCHVEGATITGAYALGGLLGTTMWGYDVTITGCSVKNINLIIDQPALKSITSESNGPYTAYIGYNGMMVGSVQQQNSKKLIFDNCSIDASVTTTTREQWLCSELKDGQNHAFIGGNSWIGRVGGKDLESGKAQIVLQNGCTENNVNADKTFTEGTDYNAYNKE